MNCTADITAWGNNFRRQRKRRRCGRVISPKKLIARKERKKQREDPPSFFFPMVLLNSPLFPSGRWPSFSIAAIFVYGTSRLRKRGRSDDVEASARGGCGRESEDVRPWGEQERLENRWCGSVDSSLARMENGGWGKKRRRRKERKRESAEKRREMDKKTIWNLTIVRGGRGGIPEKSRNRRTGWRWSISRFRISKPRSQTDPRFSFFPPSLFHNISSQEKSVYEVKNLLHTDV